MTKQVILFDNYDSFTYNLLHLLKTVRPGYRFDVFRNRDRTILQEIPHALIIGPGPMTPAETGLLQEYFERVVEKKHIPVFGVCLGMQFLAWREGVKVTRSTLPAHGAATIVKHQQNDIFKGVSPSFEGARYNSLEIQERQFLPSETFKVLAVAHENNAVMALRHKHKPWVGVQFHPESFLTTQGALVTDNFFYQYVEV
ncbi:anthranilate synthase component II [Salinivirga cyanobacteriivorans]